MEIFRQLGFGDELLKVAIDPKHIQKAAWRTSFGGAEPFDGKIVFSIDAFGGGSLTEQYAKASPMLYSSLHQMLLEPFLAHQIAKQPLIDLRFNAEITDFTDAGSHVDATIKDTTSGETTAVRAEYVVAADGGKFFQQRLGYTMEGVTGLGDQVTIWFKADLSQWMDDDTLLNWFVTPDSFGMAAGVLIPVGAGKNSDEWVLHFGYPDGQGASVTDEEAISRMLDLFKLPDLDFETLMVSRWSCEQVIASRFRTGRVIATGDAIHRHVPTLGIGWNSAIGDSHNLAWKLAYVVKGYAPETLLDTFEIERRPVLERNGEMTLQTYYLHLTIVPSIGMVPGAPGGFNKKVLTRYFENTTLGAGRRARAHTLITRHQALEHQALDLEIGYRYSGPALLSDPNDVYNPDPMLNAYVATTTPGARLAHVWLTSPTGQQVSTLDLVGASFTLIVPNADSPWVNAAQEVATQFGLPIEVAVIGPGGYLDPSGEWAQVSGIGSKGALLVRPDQHVAWRTAVDVTSPVEQLRAVLSTVSMAANTPA
jgi:2,4-dichlorophenol 6-monooxygenase